MLRARPAGLSGPRSKSSALATTEADDRPNRAATDQIRRGYEAAGRGGVVQLRSAHLRNRWCHDPNAEIEGTTAEHRRDPEGVFHNAFKIGGYTDYTGDEAHNLLLSREGAEANKKAVASMRVVLELCRGGRRLSLPNVGGGSPSGGFGTGGGF